MKVLLALPAYNEALGLPLVIGSFGTVMRERGLPHSTIVVDDGSTDGTAASLPRTNVLLISHETNLGLGRTIEDALRAAVCDADDADVIVTMDADNTHDPELIPDMVRLLEHGYDVVIASRYRPDSRVVGLSWLRVAMSYGARAVFQLLCPTPGVRDFTCGFRAYRAGILKRAFANGPVVTESGFASMAEVLLQLRKLGARMCEVPMVLRYDRKDGVSKNKLLNTILTTVRVAWRGM